MARCGLDGAIFDGRVRMKAVVLSQSMYFPWVGFLEQLRLADVFVQYDDVQFSKGSFSNRVQIKTATGLRWLSIPLAGLHLGQRIDAVQLDDQRDWRSQHRALLAQSYLGAPFADEMLAIVDTVFSQCFTTLSQLTYASTLAVANYFGLVDHLHLYDVGSLQISGKGSQRVLDVVQTVGGTSYITGHGARNYLDHAAFERVGIEVCYMNYRCVPYPQLHGDFTPFVSSLDLVANCGRNGAQYIQSSTLNWKDFIHESH